MARCEIAALRFLAQVRRITRWVVEAPLDAVASADRLRGPQPIALSTLVKPKRIYFIFS